MKRKEILVTKRIGGNKRLIMNWGRGKKEMKAQCQEQSYFLYIFGRILRLPWSIPREECEENK